MSLVIVDEFGIYGDQKGIVQINDCDMPQVVCKLHTSNNLAIGKVGSLDTDKVILANTMKAVYTLMFNAWLGDQARERTDVHTGFYRCMADIDRMLVRFISFLCSGSGINHFLGVSAFSNVHVDANENMVKGHRAEDFNAIGSSANYAIPLHAYGMSTIDIYANAARVDDMVSDGDIDFVNRRELKTTFPEVDVYHQLIKLASNYGLGDDTPSVMSKSLDLDITKLNEADMLKVKHLNLATIAAKKLTGKPVTAKGLDSYFARYKAIADQNMITDTAAVVFPSLLNYKE